MAAALWLLLVAAAAAATASVGAESQEQDMDYANYPDEQDLTLELIKELFIDEHKGLNWTAHERQRRGCPSTHCSSCASQCRCGNACATSACQQCGSGGGGGGNYGGGYGGGYARPPPPYRSPPPPYRPPSPPPPSYCTTESGKCTSNGRCYCQYSSHTKNSHNDGACFSCSAFSNWCTTADGKCTSDSGCRCQSSSHTKQTHTISSGKCYSCGSGDGGSCSSDGSCNSNACLGGNCCNANGRSAGCTDCNSNGDCNTCSSSFYLVGKKCVAKTIDGATCSSGSTCLSTVCRGANCCSAKGKAEGCTACDKEGDCYTCGSGYYLSAYTCMKMGSSGGSCTTGDTCASGDCRGGNCCGKLGQTTGCTDCDYKGECVKCSSNYFLDQKVCFATTSTKTATTKTSTTVTQSTTTTTTTTTTSTSTTVAGQLPPANYGARPSSCNYLCTHQKFHSNTCDPECNNYDCRYDHGACSRDMAASMSHARTLTMVASTSEALAIFEEVCSRYHFALQPQSDGGGDGHSDDANPVEPGVGDVCNDGRTCKHGGTCNENGDGEGVAIGSICECKPGWAGTTCEANIDDCKKDSCSYDSHGFCIDGIDEYTCNCNPGWSGARCEIKGCNVVDVNGFTHSALNARFVEDASRLQNGKSTFYSVDGQNYIYWCAKSNFYLIGAVADWAKNQGGDCVGLAYTTPSRTDFRKDGVSWNEWDGSNWQGQGQAAVTCGSSCPVVEVDGFASSILNGRFIEDAKRMQNDRTTFWNTNGDSYIYWCTKNSVYVIGFVNAWEDNEVGSCYGAAMTAATGSDFRVAEWKELETEESGFQQRGGISVECATGPAAIHALLPSPLPLPAPSTDLCAAGSSDEECATSHDTLVDDFNAQQFFAATSCISSKNLRAGKNVGATARGDASWADLQSNMKTKLMVLESMDDQISRIEQLTAKHATMVAAGSVDASLEELHTDLKALVGDSVAHLEDEISKQTREMEELAEKNEIQLKQAAALQRKVFVDELRKQAAGQAEMEAEVDSITVDVDLLLHSMASLEERIDYLHKYGESSRGSDAPSWDLLEETTEAISITQRTLLVQVRRHNESWDGLTSSTQATLAGVLVNTTRISELSSDERTALNAAMFFESEATAAFTLLDPESIELTPSQRRVLKDIRQTSDGDEEEDPDSAEMLQLEGLLSGTVTPKSLTKDEWMSWNDAMSAQRMLTGFSMIWDEDGDGVVTSSEKVGLLMDMAWPASTPEGKVLALFRNPQVEVEPSTARDMLVEQFGSKAGDIFDDRRRQRVRRRKKTPIDLVVDTVLDTIVSITKEEAVTVAKNMKNMNEDKEKAGVVATAGIDLVKASAGKPSWLDISVPVAEIAAEVFVDEKYAPLAKEAIKHTKRFVEMNARAAAVGPVAAVGGFVADTACDMTKNEYVCDMNGCIKVGLDVGVAAAKGAKYGGLVGAGIGAGAQLLYSAYAGDVDGCVNGLVRIGDKLVKLGEKYLPKTTAFVKKAVEVVKDSTVYKAVESYVSSTPAGQFANWLTSGNTQRDVKAAVDRGKTAVYNAGRAAYNAGRAVYRDVRDNYVTPAVNYARDVGRTVSRVATQAYDYGRSVVSRAASGVQRAGRAVASAARTVKSAVTGATCKYLSFWCRRRRWRRSAPAFEYNASEVDPLFELLGDAELMATASKTVYDNADALFFNTSKEVPIDMGALVHPDIEAKYAKEPQTGEFRTAAVLTESLMAYQSLAQKKVELESRIATSRFMTANVAQYLFDDEHDLQDQASLALQLLKSRREEAVFRVLEQASNMNKAYEYTSLRPHVEVNLPESPSLDDLQKWSETIADSYASASAPPAATEWKEQEATVYYTFNTSSSPDAFRQLNQTGSAYFTVALSEQSKYRDVRLLADERNAMDAYMYPVDETKLADGKQARTAATIEVSRGRFSSFLPVGLAAEPVTFLHTGAGRAAASFSYEPDTCTPVHAGGVPCTAALCSSPGDIRVRDVRPQMHTCVRAWCSVLCKLPLVPDAELRQRESKSTDQM